MTLSVRPIDILNPMDLKKYLKINKKLSNESRFWDNDYATTQFHLELFREKPNVNIINLLYNKNQIVGIIEALHISWNENTNHYYAAYYLSIGVLKHYQGCGYGLALLKNIISSIRYNPKSEMNDIYLTVVKENVRAVDMYLKYGFAFTGQEYLDEYNNMQLVMKLKK